MRNKASVPPLQQNIFRKGSKTYFHSSLFFPPQARKDVAVLYGFVRVADDLVDAIPARVTEFYAFRDAYLSALNGAPSENPVINDFVELSRRKQFEPAWAEDFLKSMEADLTKKTYDSLDELLPYIWGSAEVIGLFLCRVLDIPQPAWDSAKLLGRSMQYINFIRDIAEDHTLSRRYLPLEQTALSDLRPETCAANPAAFEQFLRSQVVRYSQWEAGAAEGFGWIPRRYLIPIKTASDLYLWTARTIEQDPMVVWRRKVKPSLARILLTVLANMLFFWPRQPKVSP